MQSFVYIVLLLLLLSFGIAKAQEWDDFEPPLPGDFGNVPPPPPPQAMPPDIPPPPPSMSDFPSPSSGGGFGGGVQKASKGSGAVVFKKTGKQKDLSKKNPRIEELLKEEENLGP